MLTAGAWDRLALSLFGSTGSVASVAIRAARNLKELLDYAKWWRKDVAERCASRLREQLADTVRELRITLWKLASASRWDAEFPGRGDPVDVELAGVQEVAAAARQTLEQTVTEHTPRRTLGVLLGTVALVVFGAIVASPLYAIYGDYYSACMLALRGEIEQALANLPVLPVAKLLTAFVLAILPLFALAIGALDYATRGRLVDRVVRTAREAAKATIEKHRALVRVTVRERRVAALLELTMLVDRLKRAFRPS